MEFVIKQVDQKVVNALTNCPSTQRCPFCHHKQSEFSQDLPFLTIDDYIQFGLSTLHFGINAVKATLKVSADWEFKTHRCNMPWKHASRARREKENAEKLWDLLGIKVTGFYNVDGRNPNYFDNF